MQEIALPAKQLEDHSIDIALGRFENVSSRFRVQRLFDDDRVCLMRHGHPVQYRRLTPTVFSALHFITTTDMYDKDNEVDIQLNNAGFRRQFNLYVSSMSQVPLIMLQTDLVTTMPRRLANYIARFHPLHIKELAFDVPKSYYNMVWHPRWDEVPSHKWMRQMVVLRLQNIESLNSRKSS